MNEMSGTEALVPMLQLFRSKDIFGPRGDTTHDDLWAAFLADAYAGQRQGRGVAAGTYSAVQAAKLTINFVVL